MTVGQTYGVSAFEKDLLRFGPDFAHWPDPARGRGAALAAADPEARALLEDMQAVSALIQRAGRNPEPPTAVSGRILRGAKYAARLWHSARRGPRRNDH
jgi:hypothetical protein